MVKPVIHFLFAEDDPLMVDLYKNAFEFAGYELDVARDGEEAYTRLSAMIEPPAVVLLDIMMPKMNGFEVLEKVRALPSFKNAKVVILSNLTGEEHEKRARDLGAIAYLVKSNYTPKQIVDEVASLARG